MNRLILSLLVILLASAVFVPLNTKVDARDNSCWGQASAVFAQAGEMGGHASQQLTPRLGLRNLARALYDEGVIPDDSLQSLGAFVAEAYELKIEACMD
jgi:hypothetical protein